MLTPENKYKIANLYLESKKKPKQISLLLELDYEEVKKYILSFSKKQKTQTKSSRTYQKNKQKDWFAWKASALISSFQRRHKLINKPYTYITSRAEYAELLRTKMTVCEYCGIKLTQSNISVDHKTPLSRGGDTNNENIAYCCLECNNIKGNMNDEEFIEFLKVISKWEDSGNSIKKRLKAAGNMFARNFYRRKKKK